MPRDGSNIYHKPAGTDGTPNFPIESAKYNAYTDDVAQDLNLPRPVSAGGTGATTPAGAMAALGGELALQVITNYDSDPFQAGSFHSAAGATSAPVAGHKFTGICYAADASNMFIEARDQDDTVQPGAAYVRQMKAGVWSAWQTGVDAITGNVFGPGSAVSSNIAVYNGVTGKIIADGGAKIADLALRVNYVAKAGDTMTGTLAISPVTGSATMTLAAPGVATNQAALTMFDNGTVLKQVIGKDTNNDLFFFDGALSAVTVRAGSGTGIWAFGSSPTVPTPTAGDSSSKVASTAFVAALGAGFMKTSGAQLITGGFVFTPFGIGNISSGSASINPVLGNYQFYTNAGAHALTPPASDCAIDVLVTNNATAGVITFSGGWSVGVNTGDPLTTVNGSKFIISMRRINAISTYGIRALQ